MIWFFPSMSSNCSASTLRGLQSLHKLSIKVQGGPIIRRDSVILFLFLCFVSRLQLPVQLPAAEFVCEDLHCGSGSDYLRLCLSSFAFACCAM